MERQIEIINKLGLHARAAAKMATLAARFGCKIQAGVGDKRVDAKSVMSLMLLAASKGTQLTLVTEGEDADEAMAALCELINDRFGEGE
ncbi:HPr family phosphocarrier protein [Simiduia sp. 21SJ11W-1]|uniref:HPr family phosphocarrier protein n=1 Tax=Simiduia sp. 21SJ11W-1 TaxID=2909669 RepID=UPI0020A14346|nr:HPr family phosphocarrier protein [Simiduia sp. 21SJ11W-1]UTA48814.1 HPr family phosphocarrier protein [Simiduia sp. 21SJ11W-1]